MPSLFWLNFVIKPKWGSTIQRFNQKKLLQKYEGKKIYIFNIFGNILEPSIEIWCFFSFDLNSGN
jgi:hypothetical protein